MTDPTAEQLNITAGDVRSGDVVTLTATVLSVEASTRRGRVRLKIDLCGNGPQVGSGDDVIHIEAHHPVSVVRPIRDARVERVAMAICESDDPGNDAWRKLDEHGRETYRKNASAAVAAMGDE